MCHRNNGFYFIGGVESDHNTIERIRGFVEELEMSGLNIQSDSIRTGGYDPIIAESTIRGIYQKYDGLPEVIFVNSTIVFEGVIRF